MLPIIGASQKLVLYFQHQSIKQGKIFRIERNTVADKHVDSSLKFTCTIFLLEFCPNSKKKHPKHKFSSDFLKVGTAIMITFWLEKLTRYVGFLTEFLSDFRKIPMLF